MLRKFYNHAIKSGGATVNIRGECPIYGYMVSMYPQREQVMECFTTYHVEVYISNNYDLLRLSGNYVGVWWDGVRNNWVLDVSKCIENEQDALREARWSGQGAIYDLSDGHEIFCQSASGIYLDKDGTVKTIPE